MIWFFIALSISLTGMLLKGQYDARKESVIRAATVESLLAIIGEDSIRESSATSYFQHMERILSKKEFERTLQNIAIASDITLIHEDDGSLGQEAVRQLEPVFARYIANSHRAMQEKQ